VQLGLSAPVGLRSSAAIDAASDRRAWRNLWLEIAALALFLPAILLLAGTVLTLAQVYVIKTMPVESSGGVAALLGPYQILAGVFLFLVPSAALILAVLAVRFMLVQE
jgi:hypothetical protein